MLKERTWLDVLNPNWRSHTFTGRVKSGGIELITSGKHLAAKVTGQVSNRRVRSVNNYFTGCISDVKGSILDKE